MTLRSKLLAAVVTLLGVLYGLARWAIPPTVYVIVSLEDASGTTLEIPEPWGRTLFMDFPPGGQDEPPRLEDGLAIVCAVLDQAPDRLRWFGDTQQWTLTFFGKTKHFSFAGPPGKDIAVAALHSELGLAEALVSLPSTGTVIPWDVVRVRLRFPGLRSVAPGELELKMLGTSEDPVYPHEKVRLVSPLAGIPLVRAFGTRRSGSHDDAPLPIRCALPPGDYGVQAQQHIGIGCGLNAPPQDRFLRSHERVEIQSLMVTQAKLQRSAGLRLALDVHVSGADVAEGLPALLKSLELEIFERGILPLKAPPATPPRWTAEATLRPLRSEARTRPWYCRWDGCSFIMDRTEFPLSGTIEGLEQLPKGEYELRIHGDLIKPLRTRITIPSRADTALEVVTVPITLEPSS